MCPHSTCIHKIHGKGEVHSYCAIGRNPKECPICIKWKRKLVRTPRDTEKVSLNDID